MLDERWLGLETGLQTDAHPGGYGLSVGTTGQDHT